MDYRINEFKKYLIEEIKSKSFGTVAEIYKQVTEFSKTNEFTDAYKKWLVVKKKLRVRANRPKHVVG